MKTPKIAGSVVLVTKNGFTAQVFALDHEAAKAAGMEIEEGFDFLEVHTDQEGGFLLSASITKDLAMEKGLIR